MRTVHLARSLRMAALWALPAVGVGLLAIGTVWLRGAGEPADVKVLERGVPQALTTRSKALEAIAVRVGFRPSIPDPPVDGLQLSAVSAFVPPPGSDEEPRSVLDYRLTDDPERVAMLVLQGRKRWGPIPDEAVAMPLDGDAQAWRIPYGDAPAVDYWFRARGWWIYVSFVGLKPGDEDVLKMLAGMAGQLE